MQRQAADRPIGRRCVVWVPPEGAAPTRLLAGLSQRQVPAALAPDAPSVMQQLASGPVVALIVVEPDQQPHLDELLGAVQTYYPDLPSWQYQAEGEGLTRLAGPAGSHPGLERPAADAAATDEPADDAMAGANGTTSPSPADAPRPAVTAPKPGPKSPARGSAPPRESRRPGEFQRAPLITPEELDMLLAPIDSLEQEPPRS